MINHRFKFKGSKQRKISSQANTSVYKTKSIRGELRSIKGDNSDFKATDQNLEGPEGKSLEDKLLPK